MVRITVALPLRLHPAYMPPTFLSGNARASASTFPKLQPAGETGANIGNNVKVCVQLVLFAQGRGESSGCLHATADQHICTMILPY